MADAPIELNGCYIAANGAGRFPISKGLAEALRKILCDQKTKTGSITLHLKNGGVSAIETRIVSEPSDL
jgi:hypothetical protein